MWQKRLGLKKKKTAYTACWLVTLISFSEMSLFQHDLFRAIRVVEYLPTFFKDWLEWELAHSWFSINVC